MADINKINGTQLRCSLSITPAEPLFKRIPTHNEEGRMLSDLMILIPRLKTRSQTSIQAVVREIEIALCHHQEHIVFADLNLKLNLLLICVQSIPGIRHAIAESVYERVPEAKLITHI